MCIAYTGQCGWAELKQQQAPALDRRADAPQLGLNHTESFRLYGSYELSTINSYLRHTWSQDISNSFIVIANSLQNIVHSPAVHC